MTPEQQTELVKLYQGGAKAAEIARAIGMSARAINNKIYALGLSRERKPQSARKANEEYGRRLAGRRFT